MNTDREILIQSLKCQKNIYNCLSFILAHLEQEHGLWCPFPMEDTIVEIDELIETLEALEAEEDER